MVAFEPRSANYRQLVEKYVENQTYLQFLGVSVVRIEPGLVEYRVAFRPELGQQDGLFHGGVTGGLAEAVMGAAARTLIGDGGNVVGAEYSIHLLAPGNGPWLLARGLVIKPGKRLMVCRADVFSIDAQNEHRLSAIAQGAMAPVNP